MAPRRSARVAAAAVSANSASVNDAVPPKPASRQKKKSTTASTAPNKRAATAAAGNGPSRKKKRTGLTTAVNTTASLGVVDPESKIDGAIITLTMEDGAAQAAEPCDVMLALVDPAKRIDKFFVLQLIQRTVAPEEEEEDVAAGQYVVYTRWGRTGTAGQALEQEFDTLDKGRKCFETKFRQKTGLSWDNRHQPMLGGKYRYIHQDFSAKSNGFRGATWQYWVDDGVDGKKDGWYDYDAAGSIQVEQLHTEHVQNPHLNQRLVQSGAWTYNVDLVQMIQTNMTHPNHTSRRIRRCPVGVQLGNDPPPAAVVAIKLAAAAAASTISSKTTPTVVPSTATSSMGPTPVAVSSNSNAAAVPPSPVKSAPKTASPGKASKSGGSHHVDIDICLWGKKASDFVVVKSQVDNAWYDVVLNQCNITGGNNNNKYYRIQMLQNKSTKEHFVWTKWGRVGEPGMRSSSALIGPFNSEEKALPSFSSKYRAKTGNRFDADVFVPKKGKYTLVEIDNDVTVPDNIPQTPKKEEEEEVEYMPSALDAKTKDLVEVLFSKEMRDEALTAFNLDLKRLPLGVPSEAQIQHGVSILQEIENKLNGDDGVSETFDELSSRFYTAIPHSFGRARPPVISTKDSLQSRYDMCNILLDMYSTNETIREIETKAVPKKKKTLLPNPVDQRYLSLNTDLTIVDQASDHYKMIQTYFDQTKGSHSRAQLLDVWSVDRKGEEITHRAFDKVDNRRLLWHGTNIAVVAPILTSGLRIMPHSGGRVGAGIYLASLQEKSSQYTSGYGAKYACMFLAEAALGKPHLVVQDGSHASSLKEAPKGFDSVHAVGEVTPKSWESMELDRKQVLVPQSKGEPSGVTSTFHHDEFLVYEEDQVRLRYMVTVKLGW